MTYVVKYRIEGHAEEKTAGPYESREIAKSHASDIVGFEGVEYARVEPVSESEVVS